MRRKIVAGNWKMNTTRQEGEHLAQQVLAEAPSFHEESSEVILFPPFTHLSSISKLLNGQRLISLGAQNCSDKESGAFTGEVSISMIKSCGAEYVLVGHSERREYFDESDKLLADKIDTALKSNLKPIFCCGEPLEIRESEKQEEYVSNQIENSLFHLEQSQFDKLVIAYEPIWAIGTGRTASSDQAQEMHRSIRSKIKSKYGDTTADLVPILYGGSCKPSNAKELFAQPDVDGGLIGGASLVAVDFAAIVNSF